MHIQSYDKFLNEGLKWKEDLDFEFPCLVTQEDPESFPCVQLCVDEENHSIRLWDKSGRLSHSFPIKPHAYKIISQNPGLEQMVGIDPWSSWIRDSINKNNIIEVREFLEEIDLDDEEGISPKENLEMMLDLCDLADVTVPYIDEIGKNLYLAKLSNGMESEMEMTELGMLKCFHVYKDAFSKKPLFTFQILPSQKWTFRVTEDPIIIQNGSLSSEKAKIIKSLIRACLTEEISPDHRGTLISYYEHLLKDLSSMNRLESGRKGVDLKDEEILRFKSLVSKYIGEKTADELYHKAKQSLYNQK